MNLINHDHNGQPGTKDSGLSSETNTNYFENIPEITTGLTWGLKRSFIRYVSLLPDGSHKLDEGASLAYSSIFHFELEDSSTYDSMTGLGILKFRGSLRLSGHHNMMLVLVADPWVEFYEGETCLTVVDIQGWPERQNRIKLAELKASAPVLSKASVLWENIPARLSAEGTLLFNEQYAQDEELDPLSILVPMNHS